MRFSLSGLFVLLSTICFWECSVQDRDKSDYSTQLNITNKSYALFLDSVTPPDTYMMQYLHEVENTDIMDIYFALLNKDQNAICFFNRKGNMVLKFYIPFFSGKKIETDGFYYIKRDSILLYERSNKNIFLWNPNNDSLKLLRNFSQNDSVFKLPEYYVNVRTPIYMMGDTVFLTGRVFLPDPIEKPQSKKIAEGIMFTLNKGETIPISFFQKEFTQRYWHNEQYFVKYSVNPVDRLLVYSIPMKDTVVVFKIDSLEVPPIYFYAGSESINTEEDFIPKKEIEWQNIGSFDDIENFMKLPRYDNLVFDKYRNVYYRTFTKGNIKDRITRVIILDRKFKKIGESELPKGYFSTAGHFITTEGIYFRKYLENEESKIVFSLFELNKE